MQTQGRAVAKLHGIQYPAAFEATAVRYVRAELERLDLDVDAALLDALSGGGA